MATTVTVDLQTDAAKARLAAAAKAAGTSMSTFGRNAILAALPPEQPAERVLIDLDLTRETPGAVTSAWWTARLGVQRGGSPVSDAYLKARGLTLSAGPDGRTALKQPMPANDTSVTSIQTTLPNAADIVVEAVRYEMEVGFTPGFDMGPGFKLTGLGVGAPGKNPPSGGAAPNGYVSARWMGLSPGYGAGSRPRGSAIQYLYDANKAATQQWGSNHFVETPWVAGKPQTAMFEATLNTPGQSDGSMRATVDGVAHEDAGYQWLGTNDAALGAAQGWNTFMFEVFRGGDSSWAVSTASAVYFYRFKVVATRWRTKS